MWQVLLPITAEVSPAVLPKQTSQLTGLQIEQEEFTDLFTNSMAAPGTVRIQSPHINSLEHSSVSPQQVENFGQAALLNARHIQIMRSVTKIGDNFPPYDKQMSADLPKNMEQKSIHQFSSTGSLDETAVK